MPEHTYEAKAHWPLHLLLSSLVAVFIGILFLQQPGFGDDFTYWAFAYDLHETGLKAWSINSFHDLRWPVWGVCWLIQSLGAVGIGAYYGVPIFYLAAGAACAFAFGRMATGSKVGAWAASIGFLFSPLLNDVCHRPMPDLSEAVLGGATVLAWWRLMHSERRGSSIAWAALTGLGVYLTESNRLTGVFIVPVLIAGTLLYARKRFLWLVLAGVFSLFFYGLEAAFYHHLFGDWLHNLNANLKAKDNKGIGNTPFWYSPFRFFRGLWKADHLSPLYMISALLGIWSVFRGPRSVGDAESAVKTVRIPVGRLVALWFILLYLEDACAPQHLFPWKPVIRDANRFLAGLSIPLAVLAVLGFRYLLGRPWIRTLRWTRWLTEHPLPAGAAIVLLLIGGTSRSFFNLGFYPRLRAYVARQPDGRKIFTHDMMRSLAIMADPSAATRLHWLAPDNIIDQSELNEKYAAEADEFWYMRKLVWLNARRRAEKNVVAKMPPLGSYFSEPEKNWALAKLIVHGDGPDLVFYRRRTPDMPTPQILNANSPELAGLLPPLPMSEPPKNKVLRMSWPIPAALRGKCLSFRSESASNQVEAVAISLKLSARAKHKEELLLKPYFYREPSPDFFVIPIQSDAERCDIHLRFNSGLKEFRFTDFRAVLETPLDGMEPLN